MVISALGQQKLEAIKAEKRLDEMTRASISRFEVKAVESGLITEELLKKYKDIKRSGLAYNSAIAVRNRNADLLEQSYQGAAALSLNERLMLSKFMAAENIVLKSLATVERAFHTPSPQERFKQMFDAIIAKAGEEKGLEILKEIVSVADNDPKKARKLKLKLTYTTHPTIMHNIQTILHRNGITGAAEDLIVGLKSGTYNTDSLMGKIDAFAAQAADPSFDLTHMKTISLEEEDALEYQNHDILTKQDTLAINAWNEAVKADARLQNQGLEIDQSVIERRTWGRRADKDGRGKSNSLGLYSNIVKCIEDGAFKDPKFDTRDNKRQNEDLVSALIQVAARKSLGLKPYPVSADNGKFAQFCQDFVTEVNAKESARTWRNPKDSIYQELGEHKAEFARRLILSDFKLVPSSIVAHTVPFAAFYTNAFNKFVAEYQEKSAATGLKKLPDNPTFDDLEAIEATEVGFQNLQAQFRQHIHNTPVEFEYEGKKVVWRFRISETGLHYRQDDYYGENEFFKKRKTVTTDPESGKITGQIPFSELERDNLMDILRRMEVLKHFANELGDNVVADRHEIANFGSASNFYDVMLLFKETGLLEIKGEKVTRSSISIVPLLETIEDLENAEAIFEQLLDDPLVQSYYAARSNVAEIMCGFSDGAKSAGNFASEWSISKYKAKLIKMFADKGINLNLKEGRGNNTNRGGTIEDGLHSTQHSDIEAADANHSVTVQSCHPLENSASNTLGVDSNASSLIGTTSAAVAARIRTTEEKELRATCEEAFDFIARVSAHYFREVVRYNKDAEAFLNSIPYNADASSRNASRDGKTKDAPYEDMRAVPVAIRADMSHHPIHHVGLKYALEELASGGKITINEGTPKEPKMVTLDAGPILEKLMKHDGEHSATDAMRVLKKHSFFETFMRKHEASLLQNFDTNIARKWGQKTGKQEFTESVIAQVEGLREMFQLSLRGVSGTTRYNDKSFVHQQIDAGRIASQALIDATDLRPSIKGNPDNERKHALAQRNVLTVISSDIITGGPAPRMKDVPGLVMGA